MAAKAAATTLEQKLKSLVDAVDADAASQVYAGAFGGLSLGESVKQGPAPPSSWSDGDGVKTATSVYAGAAQALEALASKAPLVLQEPSVTTDAAQAICKDVEKAANELQTAAALLQTDTAGAGAPLRAIARVNGRRLLDAWRSLAEALKTSKDVPQKTGIAWEAAQMCSKIPKSNRTAYRREFLQWAKELKDVLVEFEELLAQDYDDTEDAFDDPFGGLDDAYAPDQAPAADGRGRVLVRGGRGVLRGRGREDGAHAHAAICAHAARTPPPVTARLDQTRVRVPCCALSSKHQRWVRYTLLDATAGEGIVSVTSWD